MTNKQNIDQRIGEALAASTSTAVDLAALIADVQLALADAEQNVAAVRKAAADPIQSPDIRRAQGQIEIADLNLVRLRNAASQLQAKLVEVQTQEAATEWSGNYAAILLQRDQLAKEFSSLYPEIQPRIATTEQCARGRDNPSISKTLQLPDWNSTKMAWPPRQSSLAASMFAPPQYDARWSDDWHGSGAADQKEPSPAQRERKRIEAWHRNEERLQSERRRAEDLEDMAKRRTA